MTTAGIDVSKAHLDLALLGPSYQRNLRFPNTPEGQEALLAALRLHHPQAIAMEPTGPYHKKSFRSLPSSKSTRLASAYRKGRGFSSPCLEEGSRRTSYHLPLLKLLQAAHLPVGLVHPAQAKALRVGMGHRNKGDRTDASALARIALSWPEALRAPEALPPWLVELKALMGYRENLLKQKPMVEGQLETLGEGKGAVEAWLKEDLERLKGKLKEVEARVEALLSLVEEARVLLQEPGAGLWVVAAVLAYLPPEVWGKAKAAAYAGLHPVNRESGTSVRGSRLSRRGPGVLRRYLYMGAMVGRRWNGELGAYSEALIGRGKRPKQALVAVAHKLLRRLMGRLKAFYREKGVGGRS
jgi:transposase